VEVYTLRGWTWYKDSEECALLVGAAHNKGIQFCPTDELMKGNKMKMGRGLLRYEEDYDAMRSSYEGKDILGPRGKGGKERQHKLFSK
jgi:hypothetical protein